MNKTLFLFAAILCVAAAPAMAVDSPPSPLNPLRDLSSTVQGGDILIGITGATPIIDFTYYDYDPETFVVDLADVDVSQLPKVLTVNQGAVSEVKVESISRGKGRALAKIEIRKSYLAKCLVQADGNRLWVRVVGTGAEKPAAAPSIAAAKPSPKAPPSPAKPAPVQEPVLAKDLQPAKRLVGVTVSEDGTVVLKTDGEVKPNHFALTNPERMVVDLPGIVKGKVPDQTPGSGEVERVRVSAFKASPLVTRVVVDLKSSSGGWTVSASGDTILVRLGAKKNAPEELASATPPAESDPAPDQGAKADPAPLEQAQPEPAKAQMVQAPAPEPPAPASSSKVDQVKVQLAPVDNQASREFRGYESLFVAKDSRADAAEGKTIVAGGVPLSFKEKTISTEQKWNGEPISLSLKNADVKDVLRIFHDISKMNVVVHPQAQGNVTVDLENVPWDQAMDIILKNNNLDYIYENNVIWVAPAAEIARKFAEQQRRKDEQLKAEEPITFTIRLSYSSALKMETIVKKFLSDKGDVQSEPRTNTLIVREVPSRKDNIVRLVQSLDSATPQVLIEARIVETNMSWNQSFGVVWGGNWFTKPSSYDANGRVTGVNQVTPGDSASGSGGGYQLHNFNNNTTGFPNYGTGDFAVSVPASASNGFIDLMLGNITGSFFLDVRLAAMENNGRGRILSTPRIMTQDNEQATIEAGTSIPVRIATADRISVTFVSASLKLDVTPHITADGNISMEVDITNDSPDWGHQEPGNPPPIIKKAAKTVLKVKDGSTAVIGGVFKTTEGISQSGLPFFSKIPVLGWLFKNRTKNRTNEELLIFLTPKVVR
jgi:type IV pilus assembly protein PilQ